MFEIRENEQDYAFLDDPETAERNRYGKSIDLTAESGQPTCTSLNINGDVGVGDNPNRNKQHGFHFTADNCIGCHACEAACSEKNDLPAHLSFRSVGYVEGGTYPSFTRINISMACNHCDDPVCLKGCPTRAYTKHPEYGAVIQDPDICFGCGYCTWVCPYNAPQLDPVEGQVQKCNMCVDRLEVGLKPACVSACLGNALNFGVIENTPKRREQIKTEIPGFPSTDITNPNIRFQQTKSLPREFTRTDSMPVKYHRVNGTGGYQPEVDAKNGTERRWNLAKLSSRENPLVLFTLTSQAVIGAFLMVFLGSLMGVESLTRLSDSSALLPLFILMAGLQAFMLFISTLHLGKPLRFYRGFNNLRYSPLSREALGVSLFLNGLGGFILFSFMDHGFLPWLDAGTVATLVGGVAPWFHEGIARMAALAFGTLAVIAGLGGLYFMHAIYRIKARPFWNHWQVLTSFFGTMFSLGAVLAGVMGVPLMMVAGADISGLSTTLGAAMVFGLAVEGVGHCFHARDLKRRGGEGAASLHILTTTFGNTYLARNAALGGNLIIALALLVSGVDGMAGLILWGLLCGSVAVTALVSRALFYVLVIPTTMPGAFFWKNKGFEEHARETGLAEMPQVGVVPLTH